MTEEELAAIESRATDWSYWDIDGGDRAAWLIGEDIPALIAEVRRRRARAYKDAGRLIAEALAEATPEHRLAAVERAYREIERRAGYHPDEHPNPS